MIRSCHRHVSVVAISTTRNFPFLSRNCRKKTTNSLEQTLMERVHPVPIGELSNADKSRMRNLFLSPMNNNKNGSNIALKKELYQRYIIESIQQQQHNPLKKEKDVLQQGLWNILKELVAMDKKHLDEADDLLQFVTTKAPTLVDAKCIHIVLNAFHKNPQKLQELFQFLFQLHPMKLDAACFAIIMQEIPENAEHWYQQFNTRNKSNGDTIPKDERRAIHHSLLKTWCQNPNYVSRAQDFLSKQQDQNDLDEKCYLIVMDGSSSSSLQEMMNLLVQLLSKFPNYFHQHPDHSTMIYTLFLKAFLLPSNNRKVGIKSIQNCILSSQHTLRQLLSLTPNHNEDESYAIIQDQFADILDCPIEPCIGWLNMVLDAHVKQSSAQPQILEMILKEFIENHATKKLQPDVTTYGVLLQAYSSLNTKQTAQRAQDILLDEMKKVNIIPNTICFTSVIQAWSKCGEPEKAEKLFHTMQYYSQHHPSFTKLQPNIMTYNAVIQAWANNHDNNPQSAFKAEAILQQMMESDSHNNVQPNVFTYASIIHAWSKSSSPHAPKHAQAILERLLQHQQQSSNSHNDDYRKIISSCFASVISIWSRNGDLHRIENLLEQMKNQSNTNSNIQPNIVIYTLIIEAWMKHKNKHKKISLKKRVDRVLELFQEILDDDSLQADTVLCNTVISALAKNGRANEAMFILTDVMPKHSISPDITTVNSILYAWSKSEDTKNASKNTNELFQSIIQQYKLVPDLITFSTIFHTMAKIKAPVSHAEALLKLMVTEYKIKPDTIIYNTILSIVSKSQGGEKARKAREILNHMLSSSKHSKPDVRSYTLVILACAFTPAPLSTQKRKDLFKVASDTFDEAKAAKQINQFTYDAYLKAISYLYDSNDSDELLLNVFDQCCEDGYVDQPIFNFMKRSKLKISSFSQNEKSNFQRTNTNTDNIIPSNWSRNVLQSNNKRMKKHKNHRTHEKR